MYEKMTFKTILERMLSKVSNQMDKREGSIIYDALAPAAAELQLMYIELDVILNETFGDTASREYLIRRSAERGILPREPTYAVLKGRFNIDIEIGTRFSCDDLNYIAVEKISTGVYQMQCETVGVIGNKNFGDLIPIDYIYGLVSAELTELLIPGEDGEDTEKLRSRYFSSFDSKSYGGNITDYLEKTNNIQGVGCTKVTPVWNGGGTVKLTILNSEYDTASQELINTVQEEIDPTKDGSGVGVAPIGHIVTVNTAIGVGINIETKITFKEGYSFNMQKEKIIECLGDYLLELRKVWDSSTDLIVRISQIESRIMNVDGVIDITDTKINGFGSNFSLGTYEVPNMGVLSNA